MKYNEIPLLTADDVECRVQSVSQNKRTGNVGAILLLYKDARVDMRILDQVYGPGNWQRTHEIIGNTLYCNIDIWDDGKKCWIRKQDAGVESNTEKEKGRASDSFKRAGFNVGIGRELYTAPFTYVQLNEGEYYQEGGKFRCAPSVSFTVSEIDYDEKRRINKLTIIDSKGNVRFTMNPPKQKPRTAENTEQVTHICSKCGEVIQSTVANNGTTMTPNEVAAYSQKRFGAPYCADCQRVISAMQKLQNA